MDLIWQVYDIVCTFGQYSIKLCVPICTESHPLGKGEELSCAKELNFRLTQSMKSIKAGDLFHPDPKLGLQIVFFLQIRACISDIEHLSKVVPTNCDFFRRKDTINSMVVQLKLRKRNNLRRVNRFRNIKYDYYHPFTSSYKQSFVCQCQ